MRIILLVVLLQLIIFSNISAQNSKADSLVNINDIKLSETYDYVSGKEYIFTEGQYVYTVKIAKREIELYRFDTENNEMNKTPPDDVIASRYIEVLTVAKFGERHLILYRKSNNPSDRARKFNSLHYRSIDLETGDIGEEVDLDRMKTRRSAFYEYSFSADTSFLMIYYHLDDDESLSKKIKCIVFQDDFEIFEQGMVKIPYEYSNESMHNVFVTNYATPYVIVKNTEKGFYRFLKLKLSSEEFEENIPKEHTRWGKFYTYFNTKDRVDLVGTYDKGKEIFIQNIEREEATVISLPRNVWATIVRKGHFRELLLLNARPCKDGGMLVIMQEFYRQPVRRYQEGSYSGGTYYSGGYYDAIKDYVKNRLLVKLDKDKKMEWIANIPQETKKYDVDFKYYLIDGKHYFFTMGRGVDDGSLSIPPDSSSTKEELAKYTQRKNQKVDVVKLCIVDDSSGQYRLFDLLNAEAQELYEIELELQNIIVTSNTILAEIFSKNYENLILSLPLKE